MFHASFWILQMQNGITFLRERTAKQIDLSRTTIRFAEQPKANWQLFNDLADLQLSFRLLRAHFGRLLCCIPAPHLVTQATEKIQCKIIGIDTPLRHFKKKWWCSAQAFKDQSQKSKESEITNITFQNKRKLPLFVAMVLLFVSRGSEPRGLPVGFLLLVSRWGNTSPRRCHCCRDNQSAQRCHGTL